jgi:flagellar protein FliS
MVEKQKYQAYATATQTVAPVRQIILLYEGTIRLVQQAKEAIAEKRIEDRYNLLIKASELVGGLQGCLDFDNGGEIAKILYSYYSSIDARLFAIHRTNSTTDCDGIIADLKQMRDAWNEIDQNSSSAKPQGSNVAELSVVSQSDMPVAPIPSMDGLTLSA